jgi:hypothetical protein
MNEKITIPQTVLETVMGDLDAITVAMSDLYTACNNGKLPMVAAHVQAYVGRLVTNIEDMLTDCVIEAREPGTFVMPGLDNSETLAEVNARRGHE